MLPEGVWSIVLEMDAGRAGWGGRTWWLGLVLAGACAAWLAVLWEPAGRGTPDSADYVDGARQLAAGHGFTTSLVPIGAERRQAISVHPPGFSGLMVPGIWAGLGERQSAALVLGLSFVLYGGATVLLVVLAAGPGWWPAGVGLAVFLVLHPKLLGALDSILSDLPFAASSLLLTALGLVLLRREPARLAALALGLGLGVAVLLRYSGLHLLGALGGALLVASTGEWRRVTRIRVAVSLAIGTLVVAGPWLLRNLLVSGSPMGRWRAPRRDLAEVLEQAATGVSAEFAGDGGALDVAAAWLLAGLAASLAVFLARPERRADMRAPVFLLLSGLGYGLLLVFSASLAAFDSLAVGRFWLPVWPLLGAGALAVAASLPSRAGVRVGAVSLLLLLLVPSGHRFASGFREGLPHASEGAIYLRDALLESAPFRYATATRGSCTLLSNNPRVLLVSEAFPTVHLLPTDLEPTLGAFDGRRPVCIAYFAMKGPSSVEKRRRANVLVIRTLAGQFRIGQVGRDDLGEFWVSR
jgi:4-amino-4-deoxy-L-arabinose transferase-like glycosyltransferase